MHYNKIMFQLQVRPCTYNCRWDKDTQLAFTFIQYKWKKSGKCYDENLSNHIMQKKHFRRGRETKPKLDLWSKSSASKHNSYFSWQWKLLDIHSSFSIESVPPPLPNINDIHHTGYSHWSGYQGCSYFPALCLGRPPS